MNTDPKRPRRHSGPRLRGDTEGSDARAEWRASTWARDGRRRAGGAGAGAGGAALVVEHWQDGITARSVHELEAALEQLHMFERTEGAGA
jgi:hypothetical protein